MHKIQFTRASFIELLSRIDEVGNTARERALIHLYNRQTSDERRTEQTRHHNNIGFMPMHAKMMTSFAKQVMTSRRDPGQRLSPKQHTWLLKKDKGGTPRIGKYTGQLIEEAKKKAMA